MDPWLPTELDAATKIPVSFKLEGHDIPVRKVEISANDLDLREHLKPGPGIPQAVVFCEFEVPEDLTLTLTYDADWSAVWWLDGCEIYATRKGNGGAVGEVHNKILAPLKKGRHVFTVRIISGYMGWRLIFNVRDWELGITDILRTDRGALWRDYSRTKVRLEDRPFPDGRNGQISMEAFESMMMNSGVDARWIGVLRHVEGPLFENSFLPAATGYDHKSNEAHLKKWVETIHGHKMSALTWFPLMFSRSAWEKYPDWRQKFIREPADPNFMNSQPLCINSPFGDALISFLIETLQKFDFDGLWFDGSSLSPSWDPSRPVSCICGHCAKAFSEATGFPLPTKLDWAEPSFRHWVHWRYENFRAYWLKLDREVKKIVPEANIAYNNYHREGSGWASGIPWRRFDGGFIAGTEADGEPIRGLYYGRMMRGFNCKQTEVWMHYTGSGSCVGPRGPTYNPRRIIDFAVASSTASSPCSFGGVSAHVNGPFLKDLADELRLRTPYLNLPSVPQIGLHLSMQTETYVFGRDPQYPNTAWSDEYGSSVAGWHNAIAWSGLTCDVLFDDAIGKENISRYPVIVSPFAVALKKEQCADLLDYVRNGGTLVTGPWFALRDEWGEGDAVIPESERGLFPFGVQLPEITQILRRPEIRCSGGKSVSFEGRTIYDSKKVKRKISAICNRRNSQIHRIKLGSGTIIQLAFDPGLLFRNTRERTVCDFVGRLLRECFTPVIEIKTDGDVVLGIFRRGENETIVHVQQISAPWCMKSLDTPQPPALWNVEFIWKGENPKSVRCMLPEAGPAMPLRQSKGAFKTTLPPFTWGQVVSVEN
jgi:hypothetical protein